MSNLTQAHSVGGVLAGVRVVELGGGMAVPLAGMILADFGAEVVKVEPPGGEFARGCAGFEMWNRGKASAVADLRADDERQRVIQLATCADVVIEGLAPGVAATFGVEFEQLSQHNSGLVFCSITGFDDIDGLRGMKAYDGVVGAKIGQWVGLDEVQGLAAGRSGGEPTFKIIPANTYAAAQLGVQGVLGALLERRRSGRGQRVATSLVRGAMALMMRENLAAGDVADELAHAHELVHRGIRLTFLTVECADGRWIQMCARQDHHFRNWMLALGMSDVLADPRYCNGPLAIPTLDAVDELAARIRERMRAESQAHWMRVFVEEYDVGGDPVLEPRQLLQHPQITANDLVTELAHPRLGPIRQLGPLAQGDDRHREEVRVAPALGEHGFPRWERRPGRVPAATEKLRGLPLDGVTVLEIAYFLAAPLGPTLLGELGARVVKLEPPEGDPWRRVGLESVHLLHGKESIALDLKAKHGRRVLERLVRLADILVTNFRPGVPERLGFGREAALELNPSLVYLYAASYGSRGPQSHRAAFHSTPQALTGAAVLQAGAANPPVDDGFPDPCSGLAVASAALLGLMERERTGHGLFLETNMLLSAGYAASEWLVDFQGAPPLPRVDHDQQGISALCRIYTCASGSIFLYVAREREWRRLVSAVGLNDKRFADPVSRKEHDDELLHTLAKTFMDKSAEEWEHDLVNCGVAVAAVERNGFGAFMRRHNLLTPAYHETYANYWRMPGRVTLSAAPPRLGPAPRVGEHTRAILRELGFEEGEVDDMVTTTQEGVRL